METTTEQSCNYTTETTHNNDTKFSRILGRDTIQELDRLSSEGLKKTIVGSEQQMKEAKDDLDKNPHYIQAKLVVSTLRAPFHEINKRQRTKIQYCLRRLEEIALVF